ncbi:hypothetical protein NQ318_020574 [Aromia moschata]|uniref:CRAL-TRIO domain-containing protein n=1 Tax=Aromia moschata TaxID=1265417 RepID=A0AAV8Z374_9CUCU|nr:hypothetical protein NQ318_020574 [Aromia moschata]
MQMTTDLILPGLWKGSGNGEITSNADCEQHNSRIMQDLFKIANRELRENENVRKQCLAHLREWIKQNADIENCLTDYTDPKVNELISNGYIFVSPFRDSSGRRVIIYDLSKFDLQKYSGTDMARAHVIVYETLLDDEETQIMGVNHVADVESVGPAFITLFSITEFAYLIRWGEQSFPMRHKEINLINLPTPLKYVYDFAKSNMSQKLKDRFTIHDSKEDLLKKLDQRCLPLELGGKVPAKDMIELWKKELVTKRKRLLSLDSITLLSDRGIIRRKNTPSQDDTGTGSLPGSFRKLELD